MCTQIHINVFRCTESNNIRLISHSVVGPIGESKIGEIKKENVFLAKVILAKKNLKKCETGKTVFNLPTHNNFRYYVLLSESHMSETHTQGGRKVLKVLSITIVIRGKFVQHLLFVAKENGHWEAQKVGRGQSSQNPSTRSR